MKDHLKRACALALCLAMCLSVLPAAAFAVEEDTVPEAIVEMEDNGTPVSESAGEAEEPTDTTEETTVPEQEEPAAPTEGEEPSEEPEEEPSGETEEDPSEEPVESGEEELLPDVDILLEGSGSCGAGVTYEYADHILTISGSGAMSDFTDGSAPWYADRGDIESIKISSGVTGIGKYAFSGMSAVTAVELPLNGVTAIGEGAFKNCVSLSSVTIAADINIIGAKAFQGCTKLATVSGMTGVTAVGAESFAGCTSLGTVTLPKEIASIGVGAFKGCTKLTAISITDQDASDAAKVYKCVDGVLYNYDEDQLLAYPGGKAGAFTVPEGVKTIGKEAFAGTGAVTAVTLCNDLTTIAESAFENSGISAITLKDDVTSIGANAFRGSSITSIFINYGITSIGEGAFASCAKLSAIKVDSSNANFKAIDDVLYTANGKTLLAYPGGRTGAFTVPEDVTAISAQAFRGAKGLSVVNLGANTVSVGEYAFYGCNGLQTVAIGKKLSTVSANAFSGCTVLTTVNYAGTAAEWSTLVSGISTTGNSALLNADIHTEHTEESELASGACGAAVNWTLYVSGELRIAGSGSMTDYAANVLTPWVDYADQITSVTILSGVTGVGAYAFYGLKNLASVSMAPSITAVKDFAFAYCESLTAVELPESLSSIGNGAFRYSGVAAFTVAADNKVYSAADGVLYNKAGDTLVSFPPAKGPSFTIPAGVTAIGELAFEYGNGLTTLTFGKDVASIVDNAFRAHQTLQNFAVDSANEKYKAESGILFDKTGVHFISYPMGRTDAKYTVPSNALDIAGYAFYGAKNLEVVTVPASVTAIGSNAFTNCELEKAIYNSSSANWALVQVAGGNDPFVGKLMFHDGHSFKNKVTKEATCTDAGETTYTCEVCDYSYVDDTAPAALGHDWRDVAVKAATHWEDGLSEGKVCKKCGLEQEAREVIEQLTPAAIKATAASATAVTLKWAKITGATGYTLYRRDGNGSFAPLTTIAKGTILTYKDTGLVPGHVYYYKLIGTRTAGSPLVTKESEITTYKAALAKPVVTVKKVDATHISVSWKQVKGAQGYSLYLNAMENPDMTVLQFNGDAIRDIPVGTIISVVKEVPAKGSYSFAVAAFSTASSVRVTSAKSAVKKLAMTFAAPKLTTKKTAPTEITTSWTAVAGATSYELYTSTTKTGEYGKVWEGTDLSKVFTVLPDATYYYKVRAVSKVGSETAESAFSKIGAVKMSIAAPTLTVKKVDLGHVELTWGAVAGATGYEIYKCSTKTGEYEKVDTITDPSILNLVLEQLPYTEEGELPYSGFYYKVRAVCKIGEQTAEGIYSPIRYYKMAVPVPVNTILKKDATTIKISWKEIAAVDGYELVVDNVKTGSFDTVAYSGDGSDLDKPTTSFIFLYDGLERGKTYCFKQRSYVTIGGEKYYSNYTVVKTLKLA